MTSPEITRVKKLKIWMLERDISTKNLAEELSVTQQRASQIVNAEIMPTLLHKDCVERLGIPAELLPEPCDLPRGRKRRNPLFPGLVNQEQAQA